VTTFVTTDSGL